MNDWQWLALLAFVGFVVCGRLTLSALNRQASLFVLASYGAVALVLFGLAFGFAYLGGG